MSLFISKIRQKLSALLEVPLMVKSAIALLKGAAQGARTCLVSNLHARTVKLFKMSKYHVMHRLKCAYSVPLLFGIQFGGMVTSFNRLSVARHQGRYWMKAGMARKVRLKLGYEGFTKYDKQLIAEPERLACPHL
jgi:hypothetical protein